MPFDIYAAIGMFVILILLTAALGCFAIAWRHRWLPFRIFCVLIGFGLLSVFVGMWSAAA